MSAGRSHGTRPVAGVSGGGALWRVQRMDVIIMILTFLPLGTGYHVVQDQVLLWNPGVASVCLGHGSVFPVDNQHI